MAIIKKADRKNPLTKEEISEVEIWMIQNKRKIAGIQRESLVEMITEATGIDTNVFWVNFARKRLGIPTSAKKAEEWLAQLETREHQQRIVNGEEPTPAPLQNKEKPSNTSKVKKLTGYVFKLCVKLNLEPDDDLIRLLK